MDSSQQPPNHPDRLPDPAAMLKVPVFQPSDPPLPPAGCGPSRFEPPPLTSEARATLRASAYDLDARRQRLIPGPLRIMVDDRVVAVFQAGEPCPAFEVPLNASSVTLYGRDDTGDLLLAFIPVGALEQLEPDAMLTQVSPYGLTFACTAALPDPEAETLRVQCILTLAPAGFLARLVGSLSAWLHGLYAPAWMPALATALVLVLCLSNVWFGYRYFDARQQLQGSEAGIRGSQETVMLLRVSFQSNSREGDIRALLQSVDAQIIAGPSAEGYYTIRLRAREKATLAKYREALDSSALKRQVTEIPKTP